jgi:hypothetical protein
MELEGFGATFCGNLDWIQTSISAIKRHNERFVLFFGRKTAVEMFFFLAFKLFLHFARINEARFVHLP